MGCGYCREQWKCGVSTVANSGFVLWILKGTVAVCFGYCREQFGCAVGTVGKSLRLL